MFNFKRKYTNVPSCPRCGSNLTGRIVYVLNKKDCNQKVLQGFLNGELIETKIGAGIEEDNNLFCESCGARWFGDTTVKYLTEDEILFQRELHGINQERINEYSLIANMNSLERKRIVKSLNKIKKKQAKKQERKQKKEQQVNEEKQIRIKTKE